MNTQTTPNNQNIKYDRSFRKLILPTILIYVLAFTLPTSGPVLRKIAMDRIACKPLLAIPDPISR